MRQSVFVVTDRSLRPASVIVISYDVCHAISQKQRDT